MAMQIDKVIDKVKRYDWTPKPAENARLQWLKVGLLNVDHAYQRQRLYEPQVRAIAREFNWAFFGALTVKQRDGKYYVTDGQHRLAAAIRRGDIPSVPCSITESAGIEEEARSFVNTNSNRKTVSAYDKYRAMVVAKNPVHVGIESMLNDRGLHVAQSDSTLAVTFPSQLVRCFSIDQEKCATALDIQRQMIGSQEVMSEKVMKGLFYLLCNGSGNEKKLKDATAKVYQAGGKAALLQSIRKMCIESGAAASERVSAAGIAAVVNYRRNGSNRITL